MINVTVVLLNDGFASTAVMPIEVFHSAGVLWAGFQGKAAEPRFRVTTASMDGGPVRSPYGGMSLTPEQAIADVAQTDVIIVPSSGLAVDEKLLENHALSPWLRAHYERGAYVAGACMGSAYLAEAGLLNGKRATTHWAVASDMAQRYPAVDWQAEMVVTEDDRLLCSGGVSAAADVSLYLVEKLCSHEVAVETAKALLLSMPRLHQTGYSLLPLSPPHEDDRIRAVESILALRYREAHSTDDLAAKAGMSVRTFIRRFKAATGKLPGAYHQAVRIEAAKALLEREGASVQTVSAAVGYEDSAFFRALFKRSTGMTPAEYRTRFAALGLRRQAEGPG